MPLPLQTQTWAEAGEAAGGPLSAKAAPDTGQSDNVKQEWCQWGTQMVRPVPLLVPSTGLSLHTRKMHMKK